MKAAASFLYFAPALCCRAADLLYLTAASSPYSTPPQALRSAADFYGVDLVPVTAPSPVATARANRHVLGVVIDSFALDRQSVSHQSFAGLAISRETPVLVMNLNASTSQHLFRLPIPTTEIGTCIGLPNRADRVVFSSNRTLTHELAGLTLMLSPYVQCVFRPLKRDNWEPVISVGPNRSPILFRSRRPDGHEVFLAAESQWPDIRSKGSDALMDQFAAAVATLVFVRHAAGQYGWHSSGIFANLTIDDPWLTREYGFLNYRTLLSEMETNRFHTTIAMIPWNFDRSSPEVVSLFRDHPDRYSVAIHGNNHDHREFGSYSYKSLVTQTFNLKQALARMNKFREVTGIPYDRVLIFPHGISPTQTFRALKQYGYIGTVNALNAPMDASDISDREQSLRSTVLHENFPSTLRFTAEYSVSDYPHPYEVPQEVIAANAFLGNPLLFYGHHGLFASGSDAFNRTASQINSLTGDVKWSSLGHILERAYLYRLKRGGHDREVMTLTNRTCIDNSDMTERTYHLRKPEDGRPPVSGATLNGSSYPFVVARGQLTTSIAVAAKSTACFEVAYESDGGEPVSIAKDSFRVTTLRVVSDWRDMYLSRSRLGRSIISAYYSNDLLPFAAGLAMFTLLGGTLALARRYGLRVFLTTGFWRKKMMGGT